MKVQNPGLTLQEGRTQVPFLLHPNQGEHHPRPAHPGAESPIPGAFSNEQRHVYPQLSFTD